MTSLAEFPREMEQDRALLHMGQLPVRLPDLSDTADDRQICPAMVRRNRGGLVDEPPFLSVILAGWVCLCLLAFLVPDATPPGERTPRGTRRIAVIPARRMVRAEIFHNAVCRLTAFRFRGAGPVAAYDPAVFGGSPLFCACDDQPFDPIVV